MICCATVRQEIIDRKLFRSILFIHKTFKLQELFKTQMGTSARIFRTKTKKNFKGQS